MKILQLIQKPQLRGAEIFACQLSNQLVEMGHQVQLVSLLSGPSELPFKGKHFRLDRPLSKRFLDLNGWKQLAQEIKTFQPDVVQANAGDTLKFAVFSKLFFGWKAPIVFRNANKVSDFINSWPKLVFNKFLMSRVRHVISVSELCRLDFIKTYLFDEKKTTTVPIGIELKPVEASIPNDLQSIFASGKVLVHVASFVPEKNHKGLLRIIQNLIEKGEDIKVVLIGDGKLRLPIQQQVVDMNLTNHVFLLGYRNDVLTIMNHAHAFVLPSLIEGLPAVILEAMYCRIPVIAYNVGGISEIVENGKTGWLINSGNEEGFSSAIEEVLEMNPLDLNKIKDSAYDLVGKQYDNKIIAQRFLEVYKKVVGIPPSRNR